MTIRRDFDAFVSAGLARRVRGGVVAIGQFSLDVAFVSTMSVDPD